MATSSSSLSSSTNPVSMLTLLATSAHVLAYALPLFFLSLVLTFAGAFLTLDRTRVFKPKDKYVDVDMPGGFGSKKGKLERFLKMEGGLGGVIGGWSFGFHLSTFLALAVPSLPDSKVSNPLSPASFLAVYLLVSLTTAFIGGRFRYGALTMAGITGGVTFSLALSVITHPSLLSRLIFLAITTPILLLFTLLPLIKFQHGALRFALASTGSFGLITSIALLSSLKGGEADITAGVWWYHLFVKDGLGWGSSKEKGLCAAYCLFLLVGSVTDWALRRKFGECPDEKWDSYLASFTTNGNRPDSAGTYTPATSLWDRLTKPKTRANEKDPIIFPDEGKDFSDTLPPYEMPFKSKGRKGTRRTREAVKFRPLADGDWSDDDDEKDVWDDKVQRPWLRHATSSSASTLIGDDASYKDSKGFKATKTYELDPAKTGHLRKPPPMSFSRSTTSFSSGAPTLGTKTPEIDYDKEIRELREKKVKGMGEGEVPEYSDHEELEEDITSSSGRASRNGRRKVSGSVSTAAPRKLSLADSMASGSTVVERTSLPLISPASMPVPATPSLIKALDRVAMAQKDAFSGAGTGLPGVSESEEERKEGRGQKWEVFWKEVKEKSSKEDLR
ncbi:hypothetical protein V5O48_017139 [Marasmius crinis-equi]|uniref:DUF4203 domain-containing protein n=1 Tax=Marasmius crinis-equi TaxID=585013 RepID=A0ABR3EQ20_9AGAR